MNAEQRELVRGMARSFTWAIGFTQRIERAWLRLTDLAPGAEVEVWLTDTGTLCLKPRPASVRVGATWNRGAKLAEFRTACFAALEESRR